MKIEEIRLYAFYHALKGDSIHSSGYLPLPENDEWAEAIVEDFECSKYSHQFDVEYLEFALHSRRRDRHITGRP